MAHMALYRKWRPMTFEDVVEQSHIVITLKNSIKNSTVSHAYLFCGTRGTGKTTLAKIFARAVNCKQSTDGNPCNECVTCKGILEGSIIDVIEIDAASNNGVDDVREIKEAVMYVPAITQYKVYIIDEVHMLSTGAFNALLKTLEEPPENVIFILATTEPHKLPATILSRCQRFDFKRITTKGMVERLKIISEDCGVKSDEAALTLIARLSSGGMRDAISLLDQCISQDLGDISYDDVAKIAGLTAMEAINTLAQAIIKKTQVVALTAIKDAMDEGRDFIPLCNQLIDWFRNLMLYKTGAEALSLINLDQKELDIIKESANLISLNRNIEIIKELSEAENRLKWADNPRIIMEVTAIKLCSDIPAGTGISNESLDSLSHFEDRLRQLEEKINMIQKGINNGARSSKASTEFDGSTESASESDATPTHIAEKPKKKKQAASSQGQDEFLKEWPKVIEYLQSQNKYKIFAFLIDTKCIIRNGDTAIVIVPEGDALKKPVLSRSDNIEILTEAIKKVIGIDAKIKIMDESQLKAIGNEASEDTELERVKQFAKQNDIPLEIKE